MKYKVGGDYLIYCNTTNEWRPAVLHLNEKKTPFIYSFQVIDTYAKGTTAISTQSESKFKNIKPLTKLEKVLK